MAEPEFLIVERSIPADPARLHRAAPIFSRFPGARDDRRLGVGRDDRVRRRPRLRRHAPHGRDRALRSAVRSRRLSPPPSRQRGGVHARIPPSRGGRALCDLGLHRLADARRGGPAQGQARRLPLGLAGPAPLFGAIPDPARVVRDGDVFTGGGVTAGIDFALTVAAEIAGDDAPQVGAARLEYAPAPPFDAGGPKPRRLTFLKRW